MKTGAETVHWDLTDLYPAEQDLRQDLTGAEQAAKVFETTWRGKVADCDAAQLAVLMTDLGQLHDRIGRAYTFAYLHWSTGTTDAARGALLQFVREQYTQISQRLLFVEVEWAAIPEETALPMLKAGVLAPFRHYLEVRQLQKKHLLSEPEEKILSEKSVTGRSAWTRFFDETLGAAEFTLRGETKTEQEVLTKLSDPDRSLRKDAALALTEGLSKHLRTLTFVFNTVLADKASSDRLRGYSSWISSRNQDNEADDETVEALIQSVVSRYDLVSRYYRLKKQVLGLDALMDYDRYAPVGEADTVYSWADAEALVRAAYTEFHPKMGEIVGQFFDRHWIDAAVVSGKRGGAFSHGAVPSAHPYILMNFTGRVRDVQTLAHELGHGVHQYFSRVQGVFHADTPLTTAETASVFGEMLVFQKLLRAESDPQNRLSMLMAKIDDTFATVFRQVTMNRFEDRIHNARRTEGELSTAQLSDYWMETQQKMFGDSVTLGEHYQTWWSYIPHFLHTPGYVYAYAFGELLVLALYARYLEAGVSFADDYVELLTAGGSDFPDVLVGRLGIALKDPTFWQQGLSAIEDWIIEAEHLAETVLGA